MTPSQCRQARALLGWTDVQLATRAGVRAATVRYVEAGNGRPQTRTLFAIRTALQTAGVSFGAGNEDDAGVQMQKANAK